MFIENYTALGYLLSQRNITRSPTSTFQKYLACDKKHCLPTTHDTVVCMVRVNALLVMGKSGDKAIHQDRPSQLSELIHGRKCMFLWSARCLTANKLARDPEEETHLSGETLAQISSSRTSRWQTNISEHAACACSTRWIGRSLVSNREEISRALYSERSASPGWKRNKWF